MKLDKLYKMQEELDKHILEKHSIQMSKEELLDNTILALLVEIGELANTTRCFKHWSTKGMMDKEVVLDELADCLHFYLSIGNQINIKVGKEDLVEVYETKRETTLIFKALFYWISQLDDYYRYYKEIGGWLKILSNSLDFTDEEVEQAYLKKHEENYRRQREGY